MYVETVRYWVLRVEEAFPRLAPAAALPPLELHERIAFLMMRDQQRRREQEHARV